MAAIYGTLLTPILIKPNIFENFSIHICKELPVQCGSIVDRTTCESSLFDKCFLSSDCCRKDRQLLLEPKVPTAMWTGPPMPHLDWYRPWQIGTPKRDSYITLCRGAIVVLRSY